MSISTLVRRAAVSAICCAALVTSVPAVAAAQAIPNSCYYGDPACS